VSKANRTPSDVAYDLSYNLRQRAKLALDLIAYDERVNALAAELMPCLPPDGDLIAVSSGYSESIVEIWRDENGQVQAQIVDTTPYHKLQWPAPADSDTDEWTSHTINPRLDAIDAEVA
jgi:WD40 repeat protein